ncbi:hypothetical protein [Desulfonema magnum]|uniref:Uncharacterized protein n=1 Tax=Desulfonema magnum TaxID=45655 RepID=A0A975BKY3_9BACT|nr:hypothetical protein [Desulfonema magnum]QTA87406.1 Uncharacterized protein dnm_034390 [Desulfonema magnum]
MKLKQRCFMLFCLFAGMIFQPRFSHGEEIVYAISHWPPWTICSESGYSGIGVDILNILKDGMKVLENIVNHCYLNQF